jgi:hypothetical protein
VLVFGFDVSDQSRAIDDIIRHVGFEGAATYKYDNREYLLVI